MAANTSPIFTLTPKLTWFAGAVLTANTAKDGASGTVYSVFTAPASDGAYVYKLRFRPIGTNVLTVARIFINNGSATTTAANNALFDEITLPATTISEVGAQPLYELAMNVALPANYVIFVTVATGVAAGFAVSCVAANYS